MSQDEREENDRTPFGWSWNALYAAVLVNLAILVIIFYAFTKAFE